jgi:hypothetical protein
MKTAWSLFLLAGSVLVVAAFPAAPGDDLSRRFIQTTTGTVKSYSASERIVVVAEDGSEVAMELDAGTRADDSIAEGEVVTIAWLTDSLGRRRVTSIAPSSPASAEGGSSASSSPPSKAYAATESGAMSTTPSGSMASTPEPPLSGTPRSRLMTPGYATPGLTVSPARTQPMETTPGSPPRRTTPGGVSP